MHNRRSSGFRAVSFFGTQSSRVVSGLLTLAPRMPAMLLAATLAALLALPAAAGPNAGGTLIVHDAGIAYTFDQAAYPSPPPTCAGADNQGPVNTPFVWKVYAAFPLASCPRLKGLVMGESFDPGLVVVLAAGMPDPVADFEVPQDGWPTTPGGGVGIAFGTTHTDHVSECYWFGGYGEGGTWAVTPHPVGQTVFVDDGDVANVDAVAGFGSIGFGQPGSTPCPQQTAGWAPCCLPNGNCVLLSGNSCGLAGGIYYGEFATSCNPNPCGTLGACCHGSTCQIQLSTDCLNTGGTFLDESACCYPNPCPIPGACCLRSGTCVLITSWECHAQDGYWFEPGGTCSPLPHPCPPWMGACCSANGTCAVLSQPECGEQAGTFYGDQVPCEPDPCAGVRFFSVDVAGDQLVRVDGGTGVVTPLGPLDRNVTDADLAWCGGWIWVVTRSASTPAELLKIDPRTYAVVASATVQFNGLPITKCIGLAALDGVLYVSFPLNQTWELANGVGVVAESGEITLVYDYSQISSLISFNGLTSLPTGQLLGVGAPPTSGRYLYHITLPPTPALANMGWQLWSSMNDIDFLANNELWGVNDLSHDLMLLGPDGSVLRAVPYNAPYELHGLAAGLYDLASDVDEGGVDARSGSAPNLRASAAAGGTRLTWIMDAAGPARLEIFDTAGRHIHTLANGPQTAGEHSSLWDERDAHGQKVARGVYLVRLTAGDAPCGVKVVVTR